MFVHTIITERKEIKGSNTAFHYYNASMPGNIWRETADPLARVCSDNGMKLIIAGDPQRVTGDRGLISRDAFLQDPRASIAKSERFGCQLSRNASCELSTACELSVFGMDRSRCDLSECDKLENSKSEAAINR